MFLRQSHLLQNADAALRHEMRQLVVVDGSEYHRLHAQFYCSTVEFGSIVTVVEQGLAAGEHQLHVAIGQPGEGVE